MSPINGFLSGRPATLAVNRYGVFHASHIVMAMVFAASTYLYIKHHLKTCHSAAIISAETAQAKSMFSIKELVVGSIVVSPFIILVILLQKTKQSFPMGVFISSSALIIVNFNFSSKKIIRNYFFLQLNKYFLAIQFPVVNVLRQLEAI